MGNNFPNGNLEVTEKLPVSCLGTLIGLKVFSPKKMGFSLNQVMRLMMAAATNEIQ